MINIFCIKITNYRDSVDRNNPIVTYDKTIYNTYADALSDIPTIVLDEFENYKQQKQHVVINMMTDEDHEASIVNELGLPDFEYDIMVISKARKST